MPSSDKHLGARILATRCLLNLLVFAFANAMYPAVFEIVGYMYDVQMEVSALDFSMGSLLLVVLTATTHFRNVAYRHAFDVVTLGVFVPIAVVSSQINSDSKFMWYAFMAVFAIMMGARMANATGFVKWANQRLVNGLPLVWIRRIVIVLYLIVIASLVASQSLEFNFNLIDIYMRTYEIRSQQETSGLLGYLLGWFILVFYPFLLYKQAGRPNVIGIALALFGAFFVFQAFALKFIFLNFFLITAFAIAYQTPWFLARYFPQVFFLFIFSASFGIGSLAFPLLDRFFYLVGLNSILYMDFFSANPLRFFEGTKLDFGVSRYGIGVGYLIDNAYYGGSGTNQSAGFLPTIFADLGLLGLLLSSFLLGIVMTFIRSMYSAAPQLTYLIMIALAFALMNHSFNMLFLSNGLVFVLLVVIILRRQLGRRALGAIG